MDEKVVEECVLKMLEKGLGLDMKDPNYVGTPQRIARMYCREFFAGLKGDFEDFAMFPNTEKYNQIIVFDNIHYVSMCSHHFLPFTGKAWLLYIPKENLLGLSKASRLIEHYSARPQLQENLCHQIMERFVDVVEPQGAMLVMRGIHGCMSCRGVKQTGGAGMMTSVVYGAFEELITKQEGLGLIHASTK